MKNNLLWFQAQNDSSSEVSCRISKNKCKPNGLRVTSKDKVQTLTENLGEMDIILGSWFYYPQKEKILPLKMNYKKMFLIKKKKNILVKSILLATI